MKIAIIGDLHFGVKNSSPVMMDYQNKCFEFIFDVLEKNNCKTIFQLGDTFDSRRTTNMKTLKFAYDSFFDKLKEKNIDFHTVVGNHDIYYRENLDVHSVGLLLEQYDNVHVYDKPTRIEFDGIPFDFIPWVAKSNEDEIYDYIGKSNSRYALGHFEINNFEVIVNSFFSGGSEAILFRRYRHVFSGHFHNAQTKYNITYVGTPYELNWGDAKSKKGFVMFDTETEMWEFIQVPIKCFYQLYYDGMGEQSPIENIPHQSYIKVMVRNKIEPFLFEQYLNRLYQLSPTDLKVVEVQENQLFEQIENESIEQIEIKDTLNLIKQYIDQSGYQNKEELVGFMNGLYSEALTLQEF